MTDSGFTVTRLITIIILLGSVILEHKYNQTLKSTTSLISSFFNYEISDLNSADRHSA